MSKREVRSTTEEIRERCVNIVVSDWGRMVRSYLVGVRTVSFNEEQKRGPGLVLKGRKTGAEVLDE